MSALEVTVIAVCGALLAIGLVLTARWSAIPIASPPGEPDRTAGTAAQRSIWWIALGVAAGAATGVLVLGAGGRLAMRLLAVTAGDGAQGHVTEAEEIVGEVTVSGTIGFMVFIGLGGGVLTGLLYVAIHRWLPGGWGRGLWFGGLLLVGLGTRLEPLRTNNEDFDLVGPAWVSILVFSLLAFAQGAAVAAFVGRWSQTQPLLRSLRALPRYLPMVPFLLITPFTVALIVVVLVSIVVARFRRGTGAHRARIDLIGRIVLALLVLAAVPGFVGALADIADSSP